MKEIVGIVVLLLFLTACTGEGKPLEPQRTNPYPLTLNDACGNEIRLDREPASVALIHETDEKVAQALGAGDKIVFWDRDHVTRRSVEAAVAHAIAETKPDIAIGVYPFPKEEQGCSTATDLQAAGIKTLILEERSFRQLRANLATVGKVLNKEKESEKLVRKIDDGVRQVQLQVSDKPKKRVYLEMNYEKGKGTTAAQNSFYSEMIALAGGTNIAAGDGQTSSPNPDIVTLPEAEIIKTDPEIIVYFDYLDPANYKNYVEVRYRPGWEKITAVQKNFVLPVKYSLFAGFTYDEALQALSRAIHQE